MSHKHSNKDLDLEDLALVTFIVDRFYLALFATLEQTHSARMPLAFFLLSFFFFFFSWFSGIHQSGVIRALTWLVPCETAALSAQVGERG